MAKVSLTYGLVFTIFFQLFFGAYEIISERELFKRETYGPRPVSFEPVKQNDLDRYDFTKARAFRGLISMRFISAIDKAEFRKALLNEIPQILRNRAKIYISAALKYSEMFNVDPLWILSVLWTESHFKPLAKSQVNATGLMQIMPMTGVYLSELLKRPSNKRIVLELLKDPETNIELGTFYLMRLLKRFKYHRFATVAYNMGPRFVSRRLRKKLPVGTRNDYYDKVVKKYNFLKRAVTKLEKESRLLAKENILTYKAKLPHHSYYIGSDIKLISFPSFAKR